MADLIFSITAAIMAGIFIKRSVERGLKKTEMEKGASDLSWAAGLFTFFMVFLLLQIYINIALLNIA